MKSITKKLWRSVLLLLVGLSFLGCPSEPAPIPTELELDGEYITFYGNVDKCSIKFSSEKKEFTFRLPVYGPGTPSYDNILYEEHTVKYKFLDDKIITYATEAESAGSLGSEKGNYTFSFQYEIKINPDDYDSIIVTEKVKNNVGNISESSIIYVKKDVEESYLGGTWKKDNETLYVKDFDALLKKNGKIYEGYFEPEEGYKNFFWCQIQFNSTNVLRGYCIVSKNKIYVNDTVSEKVVSFSRQSSSVATYPENQNPYIGEYKSLFNDSLVIENSKIKVDIDTIYTWARDNLSLTPKTSELEYSFDIFSEHYKGIFGSQELEFDIIDFDKEGKPFVFETERRDGTFSFLQKEGYFELKQVFDIYGSRNLLDVFVKVNSKADVDFTGTWTIEETGNALEDTTLTINSDGTYLLEANGEVVEGSFDIEAANRENYFSSSNYFKGLVTYDEKLYLGFLFDGYPVSGFFVKK